MKKFFILFLCIAVLVSALCFPVSAAESEYIVQNLLDVPNYYYRHVSKPQWNWTESTFIQFNGTHYWIEYGVWLQERDLQYDFTYLDVYCTSQPTRVKIQYGTNQSYYEGILVGSYDGVYQYKIPCKARINDLVVRVEFSQGFTGTLGLYSLVGFLEVGSPVSRVNVSAQDTILTSDPAVVTYDYSPETMYVPGSQLYTSTYGNDVGELYYTGVSLDIVPGLREFDNISKLSFVLAVPDEVGATVSIIRADRVISVIEPTKALAWSSDNVPTNLAVTNEWSLLYHEFVADLSGIDLTDCTIRISFMIDAHSSNKVNDDKFTYFSLISCTISPYITEVPWYQILWNWIRGGLRDLGNTIVSGLTGAFEDVGSSITGSVGDIGDQISGAVGDSQDAISDSVDDAADDILTGGDKESDLQGDSSDAGSLMDDIQEIEDEFQDLDRPTSDSILNLFTPWLNYDAYSVILMKSLTDNVRIQNIMLIVVSFALCGFILFGKRG